MLHGNKSIQRLIDAMKILYGENHEIMRTPCRKCKGIYGYVVWKTTQQTMRCAHCGEWNYNKSKSESTKTIDAKFSKEDKVMKNESDFKQINSESTKVIANQPMPKSNVISEFVGFDYLDLSNIDVEGNVDLPIGEHVCTVNSASVEINSSGIGRHAKIKLASVNGYGSVFDYFNLENNNPLAVKIGLKKLKLFLLAANHPNPNKPGDIASLHNLLVIVGVKQGNDYTNNSGELVLGRKIVDYYKPLPDNAK